MTKLKRILSLYLAALTLAGCASGAADNKDSGSGTAANPAETAADTKAGEQDKEQDGSPAEALDVPMLTIETKDKGDKVMDFVTKPVAAHVSESIASWNAGYRIPPEPYYEACTVSLTDESGEQVIASADADVKVRGNWTTSYSKKPLRIKFNKKQSIPGLNGGEEMKNWVLLACYKDGSMLRDKTAFDISKSLLEGYYSADCELVEVTINGEYWGMYLLTEQQQVNEHRVDITEPEEGYTGTDIGYLLEFDGYYKNEEELNQFYVNYDSNAPLTPYDGDGGGGRTVTCLRGGYEDVGMSIKSDIYSKEQHDFIASYVNDVYTIMYEAAYNDKAYAFTDDYSDIAEAPGLTPREAVERVVDVQSLADSYILCELACDADLYWSSFFMDADFGEGGDGRLTFEAPWDFDSALGNKNRCADAQGFYAANILTDVNDRYKTVNPWLTVLMYEDWYLDIVKQRWSECYDAGVFTDAVSQITADSERCAAAFDRNYERWNNILNNEAGGELCYRAAQCRTQRECADYLAEWLSDRVDYLNGQWHI